HLVEEGKLLEDGTFPAGITIDELDVPESVRLVVGRRLERLGEEAQRVLAAGAVVGRAFPFSLLEEIVDVDAGRLLDIVEEAEAARVIVPEGRGGQVYYSFAHELIRQTLLSGVSMLRRQRLHLMVADAIERTDRRARSERPSEIANHLLQAGAAAEPARTLEYLELSAGRAIASAAFEEALRACEDALSVVDPDDTLRKAKIQERKGWAVRALGRYDEAIALWDEVIDVYAGHGLVEEAAALCWECGYMLVWLTRFDQTFVYYSRGLSILEDRVSVSRAVLVASRGAVLGVAGLYDDAEKNLHEAEAIAGELDDDRALGMLHWARTVANWSNTRIHDAISTGYQAIELLRRAKDQWTLVDALSWTAFPLNATGDVEAGLALGTEAAELAKRLGHQAGEVLGLRSVGLNAYMLSRDLSEVERIVREDLARCDAIQSPWVAQSYGWLAAVQLLRGDLDGARASAQRASEVEPLSAYSGVGWSYEFLVAAYSGERATCTAMLEEARGLLPAPGRRQGLGRTVQLIAAVHGSVVAGLPADAAELYPAVADLVDELPLSFFDITLTNRVAGMAAAAAGHWDEAVSHFETALRQAREWPVVIEEPQVKLWYGRTLLERGRSEDEARGRALVDEARTAYADLGMPLHTALADALLR
ncbi:MAG TPA: hypothetical protein VE991_02725, partial [Acidimicrobiales bacterium]|nr:hypothetical protein [Acidimicrobiales bacterium]